MTEPADQRRVLEAILYHHHGEGQALWHVVQEAREHNRGHALTIGILDTAIAALGLAEHPERVDALRARIGALREEEDHHYE